MSRARPDLKPLVLQAIKIIARERQVAFDSYSIPGTGEIPNIGERNEVRQYDRWLKKAREAVK